MPVSKAEQDGEAARRAVAGVDPAENARAVNDILEDGPRGDPGSPTPRQDPASPVAPDRARSTPILDQRRADIVARFRTHREEQREEQRDDVSDFEQSGVPADVALEQVIVEPAPPLQPDLPEPPASPAPPPRLKLKVHGEERELSLDEVIAEAQKSLAAGNILDQAKQLKAEMQELVRGVKQNPPQPGHHAEPQNPAEPVPPAGEKSPDQDDQLTKLIETIQFGSDPTEARNLLQHTIADMVTKAVPTVVDQRIQTDRLKDEGARTAKVLQDFKNDHPELASDPLANAALEYKAFEVQRDDLVALGIDLAQLPTAIPGHATPADIAMAHRWYRSQGYALKQPQAILEEARDAVVSWKGEKKPAAEPAPQAGNAERVVEIIVDPARQARRAAIQQQPTRSGTAPPPQAATAPTARTDPSSIVARMAATRAAPRNKVLG
jgi:hypothetical protein